MDTKKETTPWADVIAESEQDELAVMQARQGDDEQIDIAEEKVKDAQEAAASN